MWIVLIIILAIIILPAIAIYQLIIILVIKKLPVSAARSFLDTPGGRIILSMLSIMLAITGEYLFLLWAFQDTSL